MAFGLMIVGCLRPSRVIQYDSMALAPRGREHHNIHLSVSVCWSKTFGGNLSCGVISLIGYKDSYLLPL